MRPRWDDPALFKGLDVGHPWGQRLRRHQSWYREKVLKVPPAEFNGRPIPNRLRKHDVEGNPSLNFLGQDAIVQAVNRRLEPKSPSWRGRIEKKRLWHNLLSSQPLCFNLFGYLDLHRDALAEVLRSAGLDVDEVLDVRIEYNGGANWKPNSAFDAWIRFRFRNKNAFLGIECKYAENLALQNNQPKSGLEVFRAATRHAGRVFAKSATDALNEKMTCQLWYNACLLLSAVKSTEMNGALILATCREDEGARNALQLFRQHILDEDFVRPLFYEDLVSVATELDELDLWAQEFDKRYLAFDRSGS